MPDDVVVAHAGPSLDLLHLHPTVVAGVGLLALAYRAGTRRRRVAVSARERLAFGGALVVILVALGGPVDALADARCFTAHMVQHLLLALVMPPLLLLGLSAELLRPALAVPGVRPVARLLVHPVAAFALYNVLLVVMHLPPVYEAMVRDEGVHVALHLALMAAGTLLWWPLLSPLSELPRLSYPAQLLYLFALLTPMAGIAAPIALADGVLYPWYAEGPHPLGLTPHVDQVLGGLVMWIGANLYLLCIFSGIFFRWAQHEDRDRPDLGSRLVLVERRTG